MLVIIIIILIIITGWHTIMIKPGLPAYPRGPGTLLLRIVSKLFAPIYIHWSILMMTILIFMMTMSHDENALFCHSWLITNSIALLHSSFFILKTALMDSCIHKHNFSPSKRWASWKYSRGGDLQRERKTVWEKLVESLRPKIWLSKCVW